MNQGHINFKSQEDGYTTKIRFLHDDNYPYTIWFVASDIARALADSNTFGKHLTELFQNVPNIWKSKQAIEMDNSHKAENTLCIAETGVFLFLSSYKKAKRALQVHEAIDAKVQEIRHGSIQGTSSTGDSSPTPPQIEAILGDPDAFIKTLQAYKTEKALREQAEAKSLALEAQNIRLEETRANLEAKIANDADKVRIAEAIAETPTSISIGSMAKLLQTVGYRISEKKLFSLLYKYRYLIKKGKRRRTAYQKWINRGYFEVTEKLMRLKDGTEKLIITTMITGKGQLYLLDELPTLPELTPNKVSKDPH